MRKPIRLAPFLLAAAAAGSLRSGEPEGEVRGAGSRAAVWRLARKISPVLLEGFASRLTFAGQFLALEEEGPEVADALYALIADEATDARVRLAACRALADVLDPKLEHARPGGLLGDAERDALRDRLRRLYHDILLAPFLREQVGLLLALLGDLQAVEASLRRLVRLSASTDEVERARSHLELADLYYRIRQYDKAVKSYERLIEFYEVLLSARRRMGGGEEAVAEIERDLALHYYNAACSAALARDIEKAKSFLRRAVRLERTYLDSIEKDGDLANLRRDPGYRAFAEDLQK
ncbi:MAG: TPR end-of-group domain-containing protein [Planctomycetota bacterium]